MAAYRHTQEQTQFFGELGFCWDFSGYMNSFSGHMSCSGLPQPKTFKIKSMDAQKLLNTGDGLYELITTDGMELGIDELISLNKQGYILVNFHSDVDFEDEDENGNIIQEYMNVYYFGKVNIKQFTELLDM